MRPKTLVNMITFARIPLALLLVICFQPNATLLSIALCALVLSYIADIADGLLARRFSVNSLEGQLWDSLADKAVYIGAVIAMNNHGILISVIAWGLIFRDVAMYVSRIVYIDKIENLIKLKKYSYIHCVFMYLTISLGFFEMYQYISVGHYGSLMAVNCVAGITLLAGGYASLKFVRVK